MLNATKHLGQRRPSLGSGRQVRDALTWSIIFVWELDCVKKTFKVADYSILLWVFSLGIYEHSDGGKSS